ncbi:hypothetical protein ScPMuIL_007109 [Solemya velum]
MCKVLFTEPRRFGIATYYKLFLCIRTNDDLQSVLKRALDVGLKKIFITGGYLEDAKKALEMANTEDYIYCTVGCHPTRCTEFEKSGDPAKYTSDLQSLALQNKEKVIAVGECGLGYRSEPYLVDCQEHFILPVRNT